MAVREPLYLKRLSHFAARDTRQWLARATACGMSREPPALDGGHAPAEAVLACSKPPSALSPCNCAHIARARSEGLGRGGKQPVQGRSE